MKDDITRDVEASMGTTKKLVAADKVSRFMDLFASSAQDDLENLTDLLCDLRHWADVNEVDWSEALSSAERHHDAETDDVSTGYICKECGGPSPVGIGYVAATPGQGDVTSCPCGHSRKPE